MAPNRTEKSSERKFLSHQRRELIVSAVEETGAVRVRDLTGRFGVSDMTIRRDIEALAATNRIVRVHGGATRADTAPRSAEEPRFQVKLSLRRAQKEAIAEAAALRIAPGSAVGVTAGTTTFQLVRHLAAIPNLTVVTNSLPIADALSAVVDLQVVVTGGTPTRSNAMVGPLADRALSGLHLDLLFMGAHGMSEHAGFSTPNLAEAQTNQAFMNAATETVAVVDSTKWGLTGLGTIAELSAAEVLITDDAIEAAALDVVRSQVADVEVVSAETSSAI